MPNKPKTRFSKSLTISIVAAGFVLLPCLILLTAFQWGQVIPEDAKRYHELIANEDVKKEEAKLNPYQSRQERHKVHKDVFYNQGQERLQLTILAADAQMVLDRSNEETQLVEHMNDVVCTMQEELYYLLPNGQEATLQANGKLLIKKANPEDASSWVDKKSGYPMQLVRLIEAKKASYHYKTEQFLADKVSITRYAVPSHQLPQVLREEKVLMKGKAARVEFFLNGKDLNFQATQLKASLYGNGRPL